MRRVDPDGGSFVGWRGRLFDEAFWVGGEGGALGELKGGVVLGATGSDNIQIPFRHFLRKTNELPFLERNEVISLHIAGAALRRHAAFWFASLARANAVPAPRNW